MTCITHFSGFKFVLVVADSEAAAGAGTLAGPGAAAVGAAAEEAAEEAAGVVAEEEAKGLRREVAGGRGVD